MNKKGFTLIELITTFALSTVIIIILLNIISIIKNIYVQNNIKSTLALEQSNLSKLMNETFNNKLQYYIACSDSEYCYTFSFKNGESIKLIVEENRIRFKEYTYKLDKNTKVVNPTLKREYVDIEDATNEDNFLVINIPIINKLYPKLNFGIDLVYFNDSNFNNKINFKIGDTIYEAYEGMYFEDWINSAFNINNEYLVNSDYIKKSNEFITKYSSVDDKYTKITKYDVIIPSEEYMFSAS